MEMTIEELGFGFVSLARPSLRATSWISSTDMGWSAGGSTPRPSWFIAPPITAPPMGCIAGRWECGPESPYPPAYMYTMLGLICTHLLVACAQSLGSAGAHVVDNDIGLGRQSLEDLLALSGLQVDGEVLRARLRAVAAQAIKVAAHGVALQGLHVYHPHAKLVGEGAGEWAGYDGGEVQEGDALQRDAPAAPPQTTRRCRCGPGALSSRDSTSWVC